MHNFDILAKLLWEEANVPINEVKVRLDRKCWKGKKLGNPKTKMKGGVRVNNCVPKESNTLNEAFQYKILTSFSELPEQPPHGFWVTKEGNFIVIPHIWGHDEALEALFPDIAKKGLYMGSRLQMKAFEAGLVRMAKLGGSGVYGLTYHPRIASARARKTARDIASYYNMEVEDDFEGL